MRQLGELHSLTTADGVRRVFSDDPTIGVFGGYGAPPTTFATQRLFQQVGVIERDYQLGARTVVLEIIQAHATSRQAYWDARAALHDLLRPNRGGPLTLTLMQPDGALRNLTVRPAPGLTFPAAPEDNSWMIREQLELIAHDPLWYNPAAAVFGEQGGIATQLVFPTQFQPAVDLIRFTSDNLVLSTGEIAYAGTWKTYPVVRLTGPYTTARLYNVVTGATITLNRALGSAHQRVLDLTPGNLSVTDEDGGNRFGDVDPGSNLVDFAILPEPEAPDGINELQVTLVDGSASSAIEISFNARYFGV